MANTMTLESRMQLHVLVYKIVSLRITCGDYEDSPSSRGKLEAEAKNRIRRLSDLEHKSELEVAQALCESYEERLRTRPQTRREKTEAPSPTKTMVTAVTTGTAVAA